MLSLLKLISFRNASLWKFLVNHALWTLLNKMAHRGFLSLLPVYLISEETKGLYSPKDTFYGP